MRLTLVGAVTGAIGTALLLFEGIRAISGNHVLDTLSQALLWVGFGLMAVGGILLIAAAWSTPPAESAAPTD
ncbi:MAG TPA: hypothetical protein VHD81_10245 [Mycobacteriales bacterium]|nr:hypothetical protein [Mycobacteriales bacterium]